MKLLLRQTVSPLGIVGDVVDVADGYGRNYLLPQRLAVEPTEANVRSLVEARKEAERERAAERSMLKRIAARLADVEVTIKARANEDGVLYGSVGRKDIAAALDEEGHAVSPDQVLLADPIRMLDNVVVDIRLADDLHASVKVWVVRELIEGEESEGGEALAGKEAGSDGDGTGSSDTDDNA